MLTIGVVSSPGPDGTGPVQTALAEGFETGGLATLSWKTGGDAPWRVTQPGRESKFAAQAGQIGDNGTSWLEITLVVAEGAVRFWYKTSSEPFDALRFLIDGEEVLKASGEADWQEAECEVSAGPHTFRWEYAKDRSRAGGQDTAWVDDIAFSNVCHYEVVAPGVFRVTPLQSIQSALDDAEDGFTILLTAGTHVGSLRVTKSVTLRGEAPTGAVLQGENDRPVVWAEWGQYEYLVDEYSRAPDRPREIEVRLERLEVVRDGVQAAVIAVTNVSLVVRDCTIRGDSRVIGCRAEFRGSHIRGASLYFKNTEADVTDNMLEGGRVEVDGGRATIERNKLTPGYIQIGPGCEAVVRGNQITEDAFDRPGIYIEPGQSNVEVAENRISNFLYGVKIYVPPDGLQADAKVSIWGNVISYVHEYWKGSNGIEIQLYPWHVRTSPGRLLVNISRNAIQGFARGIYVYEPWASRVDIARSREVLTVTGSLNNMRDNQLDLQGSLPGTLRAPSVPETSSTVVRVPSDYATIQEAVDAVAPGGKVLIGAGTFTIGSSTTVWKPVTIEGAGRDKTSVGFDEARSWRRLAESWPGAGASVITVTHGVTGVILRALTLQYAACGILAYGALSVDNCRIRFLGTGITVAGGGNIVIRDSDLSLEQTGINGRSAVLVSWSSEAHITLSNNTFGGGYGLKWGVFLETECGYADVVEPFPGTVRGSGNRTTATEASFCPSTLSFLTTSAGGCYGEGCR